MFLRAVVVENDAGEYELQHDEVAEIALASNESCHTRDGQRTTPQAVAPLPRAVSAQLRQCRASIYMPRGAVRDKGAVKHAWGVCDAVPQRLW